MHEALVDNFNTPAVMLALGDLVRKSNMCPFAAHSFIPLLLLSPVSLTVFIYLANQKEKGEIPRVHLLTAVSEHITEIFKVLPRSPSPPFILPFSPPLPFCYPFLSPPFSPPSSPPLPSSPFPISFILFH